MCMRPFFATAEKELLTQAMELAGGNKNEGGAVAGDDTAHAAGKKLAALESS